MKNQPEGIGIKDLYLSAFLRLKGVPLLSVERQGDRSIFYFQAGEETGGLVAEYISGKALVNPQVLRLSLRELKSIVRDDIPLSACYGGRANQHTLGIAQGNKIKGEEE